MTWLVVLLSLHQILFSRGQDEEDSLKDWKVIEPVDEKIKVSHKDKANLKAMSVATVKIVLFTYYKTLTNL